MMRRAATVLILLLASAAGAAEEAKSIWLAVVRPGFEEPLAPLALRREAQGLEVVVSLETPAKAIASLPRPPSYVLLVGDDDATQAGAPWFQPSPRRKLHRWVSRQVEVYAADPILGDLDGDAVPDVPVGRIPARSTEELAAVVAKILAYEDREATVEDLALPAWSCATLFGAFMDAVATGTVVVNFRQHAPDWATPWLQSSIHRQPFCGWPQDQPEVFSRRLQRGGVMGAILGHASRDHALAMFLPSVDGSPFRERVVYSKKTAEPWLAKGPPGPPLFVIACRAGEFTGKEPCLSESLLAMPGGPVAVVAASAESHPVTNYHSSVQLLRALDDGHRRLGDLWLAAQRASLTASAWGVEMALGTVEGDLPDPPDLATLRGDQMLMYTTFGDPATRLRLPGKLRAKVQRTETGWRWEVERPEGATALHVGLRKHRWPPTKLLPEGTGREAARRILDEANRCFEFAPLPSPAAGEPWRGEVAGNGTLRLVVTGPGVFRAVAIRLR